MTMAARSVLRSSLLSDANRFPSLPRWSIRRLIDFNLNHDDESVDLRSGYTLIHEVKIRLAAQHSRLIDFSTPLEQYSNIFYSEEGAGVELVRKNLSNLQILHENTYSLLDNLTKRDEDGHDENRRLQRGDPLTKTTNMPAAAPSTLGTTRQQSYYISNTLDEIMARHGSSVESLADCVLHVRDSMLPKLPSILRQPFLRDVKLLHEYEIEQYLHSRLIIQLLCEHYVALHNKKKKKMKYIGGAIALNGDIFDLCDDASTEARHVCDANLGVAPEVIILQSTDSGGGGTMEPPPIVRSWLHHALVEVIKNAMTSNVHMMHRGMTRTLTKRGATSELSTALPPSVHITIRMEDFSTDSSMQSVGGGSEIGSSSISNTSPKRCLVIQVIDQGIGVRDTDEAFGFARSSSRKRWDRLTEQQSYAAVRQPLGSLGVGLTLSRLMLRAFGGDLTLSNNHQQQHHHHHHLGNNKEIMMNGVNGCTATLMIICDDTFLAKN